MKRLFLVLMSMASVASTFAQDVITKRDGEEIQCKILEVSTNKVKYKKWKNEDGPTFVEKKSDVIMLKYENGTKEVMTYTSPVGATQVEDPAVAESPVDSAALADTMPISKDFLEYARKEKSGLLMWGRSLSELNAHKVLGKDWTDFTRAHKEDRVGRGLIFAGGALIVAGGVSTAIHILAANDYNDKKSAYENHVAEANANYQAKLSNLNGAILTAQTKLDEAKGAMTNAENNFTVAKNGYDKLNSDYETLQKRYEVYGDVTPKELAAAKADVDAAAKNKADAESDLNKAKISYDFADANVTKATGEYQDYVDNGDDNYNTYFYNVKYKQDMKDAEYLKKATLAPMIGCYASGAALLVWGIIKEKRSHKKINEIVTRLNTEDAYPGELEESKRKLEFDMEGRENGLAFLLKF